MTARDVLFAISLLAALAAVVVGIALIWVPAAWIAGGIGGGAWAWLVLADTDDDGEDE